MPTSVRLSQEKHAVLKALAEQQGMSMQGLLESLIDLYEHLQFYDQIQTGFSALQADPQAYEDYTIEAEAWERFASDDPGEPESWRADGRVKRVRRT